MAISSVAGAGQSSVSVSDLLKEVKESLGEEATEEEINKEMERLYQEKQKEYLESRKTGVSASSKDTVYTALSKEAEDVQDALDNLTLALNGGSREEIASATNSFASVYNSMLSGLKSTGGTENTAMLGAFQKYFSDQEDLLEELGISVESSGKLSVDSEKLAAANIEDLNSLLGKAGSISKNVDKMAKSLMSVASLKISNYKALSSLYGSTGKISSQGLTSILLDALG